jgi:hypothetical protein
MRLQPGCNRFLPVLSPEMHSDNVSEYWHRLHERQSDWAFRAYSRLIMTLSEDVQEKLSLKDEATQPYIVIFGKTQVGKTTLLLDMMGIDPEQMPIISEVMRGGREQGKSATATAMEYCGSTNERWGLTLQAKTRWLDSDQAMTQALGQIREEMESGQFIAETPCVVHIPKRFFGKNHANAPKVRILDLPGDNPANEQEQKHVNQMAKTYLPFADLILLVGRGDDLGFLKPEVITLPGIEDWQAMPHRFRIVTTYSYTAQSVKDILRRESTADESVLRRRLIQEIERFGVISEAARTETLYFPLEFGNSWMGVQASEPVLHQRMSPIITRLRAELLDQIAKATTPMGRLRNTLNTHQSVKYIQKKKTRVLETQIQKLAHKEAEIAGELSIWNTSVEKALAKLLKIEEVLASQNFSVNQRLINQAANNPKYASALTFPPALRGGKDDKTTLQKLVSDYYQILPTLQLEVSPPDNLPISKPYWVQVRKNLPPLESHVVRDILDNEFGSIRSKLSDYWFDTYLSSDNYQKDLRGIYGSGDAAQKTLANHMMDSWLTALKKVHGNYLSDQLAAQSDLEVKTYERGNSLQQQGHVKAEQSTQHAELERIVQRSAEDLERCERFEHLLDEEYLSELSKRIATVHDTFDACDALLQLLSCEELKHQREELMELNKQSAL